VPPLAASTEGVGVTMMMSPNLAIQQSVVPCIVGKRAFSVGKSLWFVKPLA
jgi:hypothetical protein